MNKKFVNTALAVLLGIALFIMVKSLVGLICEVALTQDALDVSGSPEQIVLLMRWFGAATVMLMTAAFVSYAFSYFSKSVIFQISSAALSLVIVIALIVFCSQIYTAYGNNGNYFATGIVAIEGFVQIMLSATIFCVFYTLNSVRFFIKRNPQKVLSEVTEDEEA